MEEVYIFLWIYYSAGLFLFQMTFLQCRVKNKIVAVLILLAQSVIMGRLFDSAVDLVHDTDQGLIIIIYILSTSVLPVLYTKGNLIKRFICACIYNLLFFVYIIIMVFVVYGVNGYGESYYATVYTDCALVFVYFVIVLIQARICYVVNKRRMSS